MPNSVTRLPDAERQIVDAFHRFYFDAGLAGGTRENTYWLGTKILKNPLDLWIYQELILATKPTLIIETGTHAGGSALFLASVLDLRGGPGRVVSIDLKHMEDLPSHPRITYVEGSSTDPAVVENVRHLIRRDDAVMVILDSDHSEVHVLRELECYAPHVSQGCYLIVEDTNINGRPVLRDFGPGPHEAMDRFLASARDFEVDESAEKFHFTFNPRGYIRRVGDEASGSRQNDVGAPPPVVHDPLSSARTRVLALALGFVRQIVAVGAGDLPDRVGETPVLRLANGETPAVGTTLDTPTAILCAGASDAALRELARVVELLPPCPVYALVRREDVEFGGDTGKDFVAATKRAFRDHGWFVSEMMRIMAPPDSGRRDGSASRRTLVAAETRELALRAVAASDPLALEATERRLREQEEELQALRALALEHAATRDAELKRRHRLGELERRFGEPGPNR